VVIALWALEMQAANLLHGGHFIALLALVPKTVWCFLFVFGGSLNAVFQPFEPTHLERLISDCLSLTRPQSKAGYLDLPLFLVFENEYCPKIGMAMPSTVSEHCSNYVMLIFPYLA
jgi:hypothetical protein